MERLGHQSNLQLDLEEQIRDLHRSNHDLAKHCDVLDSELRNSVKEAKKAERKLFEYEDDIERLKVLVRNQQESNRELARNCVAKEDEEKRVKTDYYYLHSRYKKFETDNYHLHARNEYLEKELENLRAFMKTESPKLVQKSHFQSFGRLWQRPFSGSLSGTPTVDDPPTTTTRRKSELFISLG